MKSFMRTLIACSEKAASIARACRKEKDLFQLLVEEKTGDQKNVLHAHDFKTLADVLIQETVRHDIGQRYPRLAHYIQGEESNEFTNTLGEKIRVEVCSTKQETSKLLCKVLDGHKAAADLLAKEVHSDECFAGPEPELLHDVPEDPVEIDDLGIWIDPIDGTNNYVRGHAPTGDDVDFSRGLSTSGLAVVTVLIGVFNRTTGRPVAGVVNQPFVKYNHKNNTWSGQVHWGITTSSSKTFSSQSPMSQENSTKKIIVSITEAETLKEALTSHGYEVVHAGGAGYKILSVILGWADLYITLLPSTYNWDCCAGHAILASMGGGGCQTLAPKTKDLFYNQSREDATGIQQFRNDGGVVAYRNIEDLKQFLKVYKNLKKPE